MCLLVCLQEKKWVEIQIANGFLCLFVTPKILVANWLTAYVPMFCNGGGFLSVKDAFSETGYPAFYR